MNVYPRKSLEVFPTKLTWGKPWEVVIHLPSHYTDDEFAEHFIPAGLVDELIAAAIALSEYHKAGRVAGCECDFCAAVDRYAASQPERKE